MTQLQSWSRYQKITKKPLNWLTLNCSSYISQSFGRIIYWIHRYIYWKHADLISDFLIAFITKFFHNITTTHHQLTPKLASSTIMDQFVSISMNRFLSIFVDSTPRYKRGVYKKACTLLTFYKSVTKSWLFWWWMFP